MLHNRSILVKFGLVFGSVGLLMLLLMLIAPPVQTAEATTSLVAGDIIVIGFSADPTPTGGGAGDSISFVPLVDLTAGTVITFTDSGWLGTAFRANEGGVAYTVPAGGISAGTLISASGTTNPSWDANGPEWTAPQPGVGSSGLSLASSGDQILVFTGNSDAPNFIFAVNGASTIFSDPANADDSNRTALPTGLVDMETAVAVGAGSGDESEYDNVYYTGITSGTRAEILAAVTDPANWVGHNTAYVPYATDFVINEGVQPLALPFTELFDDCTLENWTIVSVDSDTSNSWACNSTFSYSEANGFGDSAAAEDWLLLPPIDLDASSDEVMQFRSYTFFTDSGLTYPQLSVQYSIDYTGSVTTAMWTELTGFTYSAEDSGVWISSGAVDISMISGSSVTFAFKYQSSGTGSGTSSSWRIDTVQLYEAVAEPTNHVTGLAATADSDTQITTSWTDSAAGTQAPAAYLVLCTTGVFSTTVVDGTAIGDDVDCSDGDGAQNIAHGAGGTAVWTGLNASTAYTFTVYPYSNSGFATDFKTDGTVPTATATTSAPIPSACDKSGGADTCIHDVQGSGTVAALSGSSVIVEGIVIGVYPDLDGFFMQEEDSDVDMDSNTSEGLFVYVGGVPSVAEGDKVLVDGSVSDYFEMTQITDSTPTVVSSGNTMPSPAMVSLPAASGTDEEATFESVEGMLVQFANQLTVSEYYELARYGHMVLTEGGRITQYTQIYTPTLAGYTAYQADVAKRRIFLDDDNNQENNDTADVFYPQPDGFSTTDYVRGGYTVDNLTGIMHWSWAGRSGTTVWRIRPTETYSTTFNADNPRATQPADVGGELTVATLNVLNFFTTIDTTASRTTGDCGPTATLDCRGADNAAELVRQTQKLTATLIAMDADIVGLVEIENNADASLQAVVDGVNGTLGAGTYAYIDTGYIGTDAIKVGFIYKPAAVTPVGSFEILDSTDDARFIDTKNRPVLAQTFQENSSGEKLTIAVNHFKSKGSGCGEFDDDTTTGQGNCNGTRTDAAAALADWLATDPTGSGDPDFMIIGDLNAYAMEDPIQAILSGADDTSGTADDYTNLIQQFLGNNAYSFVFSGQWGYLDHALATESLMAQVTGVTEWHVNADEASLFDYNDGIQDTGEEDYEDKPGDNILFAPDVYRNSDHDPLIVGLNLGIDANRTVVVNNDDSADITFTSGLTLFYSGTPYTGFASTGDSDGTFNYPQAINGPSFWQIQTAGGDVVDDFSLFPFPLTPGS